MPYKTDMGHNVHLGKCISLRDCKNEVHFLSFLMVYQCTDRTWRSEMNGWPVCPSDSVSQILSSEMSFEQVLGIVPARSWAFNQSGSTLVPWSPWLAATGTVSLEYHPSFLLQIVSATSVFFPRGKAHLVHYRDGQQGCL